MTNRLNITAKIWLSVGVFVLGYVLSTVFAQVQGLTTERTLRNTSTALFPAAQRSQEAEAGFQRAVKGFSDAVLMQDASGLDRATEDGRLVKDALTSISKIPGISAERSKQAKSLASSVDTLMADARATYGSVLASPANMNADVQTRMQELAGRTDAAKASLAQLRQQISGDLNNALAGVGTQSAMARWIGLGVFIVSVLLAAVIVNLTIRRAITGPIVRVINGVQNAARRATDASGQMMESGQVVARDAQDQAACIEETSASLEEISATTRENASRAGKADDVMRNATAIASQAGQAMADLTNSMSAISSSSTQVAGVLKSIDEIAFHTNILSLNAAVEAARAGEAGAGFSVVADEVRALALRAAEAARRSGEIIEKTITDVRKGVELVTLAQNAFSQVTTSIASGSEVMTQIARSSNEQAKGVAQIGEAVARMQRVTQNNATNAQQTAEVAASLTHDMQSTQQHVQELIAIVGLRDGALAPTGSGMRPQAGPRNVTVTRGRVAA